MDIKIKDFEGPLDLLLHLVSKYQVDIYDVPITEVIEQYLAYIATLQAMRLEVAGDYMLMASQLMLIKSRKLLPKVVAEQEVNDDPELDLLNQLEEYRKFKLLSQKLSEQHDLRAQHFSKPRQELIFEEVSLKRDKTSIDLFLAFSQIMAQKKESFKQNHATIEADDYKIEDMMAYIERQFSDTRTLCLQQLFQASQSMSELITMFLATLELVKIQVLTVVQEENFSQIYLQKETYEPTS
ncbi:segregation/condensation protein A [Streptococcus ovuberis]|uniref:Segregation and condensation protein A n=1 Tax=Streptococcus ovuberis TaxID=1936207 RepID=A0A7X6S127_9STRE|nr:segregation/condensation protein A [Streptococcus ovuberis]NKZ19741.1 segregation/condensation protein A [Streptococcus ovuberis]